MITNPKIDHGKGFDWGKASLDYAKYRDIYPDEFYQRIVDSGLCVKGQKVLDIGTGTGVLPRNLYHFGAEFTGIDISEQQIQQARKQSEERGMKIRYIVSPAENLNFSDSSFDVVTACQCFQYFDVKTLTPLLVRMLKPGGRFAILFMSWLPEESEIAARSEELVLKYNPKWTGKGATRQPPKSETPPWAKPWFKVERTDAYDIGVTFTRESWNGRIKACRGIGASLSEDKVAEFEREHLAMLSRTAPDSFQIPHYVTSLVLRVEK